MAVITHIEITPEQDTRLADHLAKEIEAAISATRELDEKRKTWERLYEGKPLTETKSFPWKNASNVEVPLIGMDVDAIVARLMEALFSVDPNFWKVRGLSAEAEGIEDDLQAFLNALTSQEIELEGVMQPLLIASSKKGNGYLKVPWLEKMGKIRERVVDGKSTFRNGLIFEGVKLAWIPTEDVIVPTDAVHEQTAQWISHRQFFRWGRIKDLERDGFLRDVEEKLTGSGTTDIPEAEQARARLERIEAMRILRFELHEVQIKYDIDDDGFEEDIVVIWDRKSKKTLAVLEHPYDHGRRYVVRFSLFPREGRWHGMGVAEYLEFIQAAATTLLNQAIDAATAANTGFFRTRKDAGIKDQVIAPMQHVFMENPEKDMIPTQLGGPAPATFSLQIFLKNLAEGRIGVTEQSIGKASRAETATTTISLLQESLRRLSWTLRNHRASLTEVAFQVLELYQQFRPVGKAVMIRGEEGGKRVEQIFDLPLFNLREKFQINASGTIEAPGKEVDRQLSIQLFQLFSGFYEKMFTLVEIASTNQASPELQAFSIEVMRVAQEFMKEILTDFDIQDVKRFMPDVSRALNISGDGAPAGAEGTAGVPSSAEVGTQGS